MQWNSSANIFYEDVIIKDWLVKSIPSLLKWTAYFGPKGKSGIDG